MKSTLDRRHAAGFAPLEQQETPALFRDRFDRSAFLFRHEVTGHELFTLDCLRVLAMRMAPKPGRVYYDTGAIRIGQKWGQIPVKNSLEEALDQLEDGDAWVILKQANLEPEYGPVLDAWIDCLSALTGRDLNREIGQRTLSIVISSPRRVTPYHMDGEYNFLLQCQGSKTMYVFDGRDRSIVTDAEIERYWNRDRNAAQYKEAAQSSAGAFELTPGLGLHVPLLFPHWVKNGPQVSVSVSINFEFLNKGPADVYRANYYLRKLGLRPTPPGRSGLLDWGKVQAVRAFDAVREGSASRFGQKGQAPR